MNPDPASLDNLRSIVEPPAVSWWPPAPGWWVVAAACGLAALVVAVRRWRVWRANAYRRAALRELSTATDVAEIAEILKRTALCAYPRVDVASLSGGAWVTRLEATARQPVPAAVGEALTRGVYGRANTAKTADVASFAGRWIRNHRRSDARQTDGDAVARVDSRQNIAR
jgi:hypothetical protein